MAPESDPKVNYWDFILRRMFSLAGIIPVGAYLTVHLFTNASVLDSPEAFQRNVYLIHGLGPLLLPVIEWVFIFIPLLFHAAVGFYIIAGGLPNTSQYPYESNVRYTLQRVTGMIAFVFILWHVFHMHGWIHTDWWLDGFARRLGGAQFAPYNAGSTAAMALSSGVQMVIYIVGTLASVFHFANGIWTFGITWGLWVTPAAQYRAGVFCGAFGLLLAVVGMSALWGMARVDVERARKIENEMYTRRAAAYEIAPNEHKRWHPHAPGTHEGSSE